MENEAFLPCLPNAGSSSNHHSLLYSQMMPSMSPPSLNIPGSPKQSPFHKSLIQQPPISPSKKRIYNTQSSAPSPFTPISPLSPQMTTPNSDNDSSRNTSGDSAIISFSNLSDPSTEFTRSCLGSDSLTQSLNITSPSSCTTSPSSVSLSVPSTPNPSSNRVLGNGRRFRSAVKLVMNEKRATSHYKQYKYNASDLVSHVAEFSQRLATVLETNASQLQSLMESYKDTHEQFLKERVDCPMHLLNAWEVLTKEFERRSEQDVALAKFLASEVSIPLYDLVQCKKQVNKKNCKDDLEISLEQQEDLLSKAQKQYNEVYNKYKSSLNKGQAPSQTPGIAHVYNTHNCYVLQLKAMTAWIDTYSNEILPLVSQENEKTNEELIYQLDRIFARETSLLSDQYSSGVKRMQHIHDLVVCSASSRHKRAPKNNGGFGKKERNYEFMKPDVSCTMDFMKNELAFNDETEAVLKRKYYSLAKEANNIELNIDRFKNELESLNKVRESGTCEKLLAKTPEELNGDIASKQNQIREQTCLLSAVREQLSLFNPSDWWPEDREQDQLSSRTKHILEQKFNMFDHSERSHAFVEYTFKKLTYCDYCRNLLRGIVKQGLKCKYCKMAVHASCAENASYCTRQPKITPHGWRPERSQSMIEEIDPVFNAIRYASSLSAHNRTESISSNGSGGSISQKRESADLGYRTDSRSPSRFNPSHSNSTSVGGSSSVINPSPSSAGGTSPNSLSMTMSSPGGTSSGGGGVGNGGSSAGARLMVPSMGGGNDGSGGQKHDRSFSLESSDSLPKSTSSVGSRSPPSPRLNLAAKRNYRNPQQQICLAIRDFTGSKPDDLHMKRGDIINILGHENHDWIRGVSNGVEGYFPESFVIKLAPEEYLMRVTHSYSGSADNVDEISLKKDQIVVFQGEEQPGWCYIRTDYNETGVFPMCYLAKYR